jgi:hypothetical protein
MKMTCQFHPASRLRMSTAVPLLPCMHARHTQGKIYPLPNTVTQLTILSQGALGHSVPRFYTEQGRMSETRKLTQRV